MTGAERLEETVRKFAEELVTHPKTRMEEAEEMGGLLATYFQPLFPWEKGDERRRKLNEKDNARRRMRVIAEGKGLKLPF